MQKTLILDECKWTLGAAPRKVIAELVEEKATRIVPEQGHWQVYFLGFSRSGWISGATAYVAALQQSPPSGANWTCAGAQLMDLNQVDSDLAAWSA